MNIILPKDTTHFVLMMIGESAVYHVSPKSQIGFQLQNPQYTIYIFILCALRMVASSSLTLHPEQDLTFKLSPVYYKTVSIRN